MTTVLASLLYGVWGVWTGRGSQLVREKLAGYVVRCIPGYMSGIQPVTKSKKGKSKPIKSGVSI